VRTPRAPVRTRTVEGTFGLQWDPLRTNSFNSQFNFNKREDFDKAKQLPLRQSLRLGSRELSRDHSTRLSWRPGWLSWFRPVFSYDTSYQEDGSPAVQPADLQNRSAEDARFLSESVEAAWRRAERGFWRSEEERARFGAAVDEAMAVYRKVIQAAGASSEGESR